jgi:DNA gyrase subunit A
MGRSAQGNPALRLRYGEQLVGCITLTADDHLLLVSQLGYAKRLPVAALRLAKLGEIGTQALQFTTKTDNLAGMILAKPESEIMVLTNLERRIILSVEAVSLWGKDGPGDLIVKLKPEEEILSIKSY